MMEIVERSFNDRLLTLTLTSNAIQKINQINILIQSKPRKSVLYANSEF